MKRRKSSAASTEKAQEPRAYLCSFQLREVRMIKVNAELCEPTEQEEANVSFQVLPLDEDQLRSKELDLGVQFEVQHLNVGDEAFNMSLVLAGHFAAIVDPSTVDPKAITRFVEEDAFDILFPYLRETVHNLTTRMGLSLTPLPILNPHNTAEDSDEEDKQASK